MLRSPRGLGENCTVISSASFIRAPTATTVSAPSSECSEVCRHTKYTHVHVYFGTVANKKRYRSGSFQMEQTESSQCLSLYHDDKYETPRDHIAPTTTPKCRRPCVILARFPKYVVIRNHDGKYETPRGRVAAPPHRSAAARNALLAAAALAPAALALLAPAPAIAIVAHSRAPVVAP